jgi:hypothetical protein
MGDPWSRFALLSVGLLASCSKSESNPTQSGSPASSSPLSAVAASPRASSAAAAPVQPTTQADIGANCRGTLSGAATGPFTCYGEGLFFLPAYQDSAVRGNTEVSLMSSAQFHKGTPPPGVRSVSFAGVFRGELKPGTYTEKDLVRSQFDVANVSLEDKRYLGGLKRVKLTVKSVSSLGVHDDVVTKGGPMRNDRIAGDLELSIGGAAGEVLVQATLN